MRARFGPAGNSDRFYEKGHKSTLDAPSYLRDMGLSAFEYQCGRGITLSLATAAELGRKAAECDITLSLHAPYYISLASSAPEKREASIRYILKSAQTVQAMGGNRIVVHPGSYNKQPPDIALETAKDTLRGALSALDEQGLGNIRMCIETMGKNYYLGSLEETLALCSLDERMLVCVDFGHLNARSGGGLKTMADFETIFQMIENKLGLSRLREFHAHFSKIEYGNKGEIRHLTFADRIFGPDFEPVLELTLRKNCSPTIICESRGTQDTDAQTMRACYERLKQPEKGERL